MSTLTGTVTSEYNHAPVDDVLVTATSKELQGEQVVVTQANGTWEIPDLPSGMYTLRFEKPDFKPRTESHINLEDGGTKRVNVELLPEGIGGGGVEA